MLNSWYNVYEIADDKYLWSTLAMVLGANDISPPFEGEITGFNLGASSAVTFVMCESSWSV